MRAKTERERDYIYALLLMYTDYDKLNHVQRIRTFRDAQEKIAAKYPDDDEAQSPMLSRSTLRPTSTTRHTPSNSRAQPFSSLFRKRLPRHPGVTHYLIHLYDYSALAAKGLDAANRYAKRRPSLHRTPSTCLHTSTLELAIGSSRSIPMLLP